MVKSRLVLQVNTEPVTVHLFVVKLKRLKFLNIADTHVLSVEKTLLNVKLLVSGNAEFARKPLQEVLGLSRKLRESLFLRIPCSFFAEKK